MSTPNIKPRFRWKLSYQNEVEYEVYGSLVKTLRAYSVCDARLLEYQRKTVNYNAEEFELIMVTRQGGVMINYIESDSKDFWEKRRWTEEFYLAFVDHLRAARAEYIVHRAERLAKMGWTDEEYPLLAPQPIPQPMYYDAEGKTYRVEPFYRPEMSSWPATETEIELQEREYVRTSH